MTTLTTAGLDRIAIATRLREALAASQKTKALLAREVGVSWQTVNDWTAEEDPRLISTEHLFLVAKALHVTADQLLGIAAGQDPPFESWPEFLETPEGKSMTIDERRECAAHPWLKKPSVTSYLLLLAAIRSST